MMMTNGFGMGGGVFMALFTLVFLMILGTFLAMLLRGIGQWSRDNRSPRLTVGALVTAKRTNVSHHRHSGADGVARPALTGRSRANQTALARAALSQRPPLS